MPVATPLDLSAHALARRLRRLSEQHDRLTGLCDELEGIADELPKACPARCRNAAQALKSLLPAHHGLEIGLLSELLAAGNPQLLARIARQHGEDEGLAHEIAQGLEPLIGGDAATEPETLGYMLRCFFTGYRRAMLVEQLAVRSVVPAELAESFHA